MKNLNYKYLKSNKYSLSDIRYIKKKKFKKKDLLRISDSKFKKKILIINCESSILKVPRKYFFELITNFIDLKKKFKN